MSASTLESVARDVFERELNQWETGDESSQHVGGDVTQVCPVSWLLPDLLLLIAEHHDEPVRRLRPSIRQLVAERAALYTCSAGVGLQEAQELIDQQVDLLVRVLEQVRQQALRCGQWSEMHTLPEMFG